VTVGLLRRSISGGSSNRRSQARAPGHASLRTHPMPSRTIEQSHGPRVSDRTVLPIIAWTTVRLVMFQKNDGRRHNSEMEPQGRGSLPPLYTRRQNRALSLSKTTHEARVHVQTVGLNAETKKNRHRAERETFLDIPFNRTSAVTAFSGV
jgi:hypothetical protein